MNVAMRHTRKYDNFKMTIITIQDIVTILQSTYRLSNLSESCLFKRKSEPFSTYRSLVTASGCKQRSGKLQCLHYNWDKRRFVVLSYWHASRCDFIWTKYQSIKILFPNGYSIRGNNFAANSIHEILVSNCRDEIVANKEQNNDCKRHWRRVNGPSAIEAIKRLE